MRLALFAALFAGCVAHIAQPSAPVEVCITGPAVNGIHRMACGDAADLDRLEAIIQNEGGR